MMIGLPVISLDWGGPALLVTPETGFLITPGDEAQVVADLADRMDRLGEDAELAQRLANRSREVAIERGFGWSDLIEKWIAIYRELAHKSQPVSADERR